MTDNLADKKRLDGFEHESPVRAFTDFQVCGSIAIGKGFRPSLQHLAPYLDAMERKEKWRVVQIISVDGRDPTILFHRDFYEAVMPELEERYERPRASDIEGKLRGNYIVEADRDAGVHTYGEAFRLSKQRDSTLAKGFERQHWSEQYPPDFMSKLIVAIEQDGTKAILEFLKEESVDNLTQFRETASVASIHRALRKFDLIATLYDSGACDVRPNKLTVSHGQGESAENITLAEAHEPAPDDPVNPKHYAGTACAEIGELLTANSFQVLKYNWRLGEKDSPCVELGKAIWYLDREIAQADTPHMILVPRSLPEEPWFSQRLQHGNDHARAIARILVSWNRYGNIHTLRGLRKVLQTKLDALQGCPDWGRGLAV